MPVSGVISLFLLAFVAGLFVYGAFLAEPVDVDSIYCESTAQGWQAAHVNIYTYLEVVDPELFKAQFLPVTLEGRQALIDQCEADPVATRKVIGDLLSGIK
jgi:hypothetical protein